MDVSVTVVKSGGAGFEVATSACVEDRCSVTVVEAEDDGSGSICATV